jgi:hypothetical protein
MRSDAKIRGYGGALGGGKSRTGSEVIFDACLDHPGITCLVAREAHTSIVETTKKTMLDQVIPPELIDPRSGGRSKASQGEDYVQLYNGSTIHFIGLDNPYRWYSSEVGYCFFDEAQEMDESKVTRIITRLRQQCADCLKAALKDTACPHMPNRAIFSFNPAEPGHWLQQWFILGGTPTDYGMRKDELYLGDAAVPIGSCEFVKALAKDNPYLPPGYVEQTLSGLPSHLRRRYLEGIWEFISGTCYFDEDALTEYRAEIDRIMPRYAGHTEGAVGFGRETTGDKIRLRPAKTGPWAVWELPVKTSNSVGHTGCTCPQRGRPHEHRYVVTVDTSSGGSTDYSAVQVIDLEEFAQVAEFQGKLDPDLLAVEAYRIGRIYNDALIVPETTGGWGFTIVKELQDRLRYRRVYTRSVLDRRTRKLTDKLGWDTNRNTRPLMLDTLERVLRERQFRLRSERTLLELYNFIRDDDGKPAARSGTNDDLVIALAIGVLMCEQMPRQLRKVVEKPHQPAISSVTGY